MREGEEGEGREGREGRKGRQGCVGRFLVFMSRFFFVFFACWSYRWLVAVGCVCGVGIEMIIMVMYGADDGNDGSMEEIVVMTMVGSVIVRLGWW